MADNISITAGSGTTIAADDIGGVLHQRVKLSQGADGAATDVSSASPLNVTLANTGANATAVKVDNSAVTQPISASSLPLPALAATSTKQSDGSQKSQIVDGSGNVIGATSNALDVNIKSGASSGTQYADGAARGTATGTLLMVDDGTLVQSAAGTSAGVLKVDVSATTANGTAIKTDGSAVTQPVSGTVAVSTINSVAPAYGSGVRGATVQRVTIATDDVVPISDNSGSITVDNGGTFAVQAAQSGTWTVQPGNTANTTAWKVDGSAVTQPVSGTVSITTNSAVNVAQMNGVATSMGAGANGTGVQRVTLATDQTAVTTAGVFSVKVDQTTDGTTNKVSATQATASSLNAQVVGAVASDGVDSGNPIKIGGKAVTAEITAVANADRVDAVFDVVGKQIVLPYANPENFVSGAITTSMTGTTSTSLVAAPAAGLRNYLTTIIVSNAHATVGTDVIIQDGSGGTTLLTIPAAAVYGGAVINLPVPLRQPTTATAIFCANVTTGASTKVSAVGYKGA